MGGGGGGNMANLEGMMWIVAKTDNNNISRKHQIVIFAREVNYPLSVTTTNI